MSTLIGGAPKNRTLGMTVGTLLFAVGIFFWYRPQLAPFMFGMGLLSGLSWSFGQIFQFRSMNLIGVTLCIPLSNGMQLIGNTVIGALIYREWSGAREFSIGIPAILLLLAGLFLTVRSDRKDPAADTHPQTLAAGLKFLLLSTLGYILFFVFSQAAKTDVVAIVLPQAIGMFTGALCVSLRKEHFDKHTLGNIISGLMWGFGNLFLLFSISRNGLAVSFSIIQTGIIISTVGALWILKEKKTPFELRNIFLGCFLVVFGGILLGWLKSG